MLYADDDGKLRRGVTLGAPTYDDQPSRLLVGGGGIRVVEARYSQGREPGTWSRLVEPAR